MRWPIFVPLAFLAAVGLWAMAGPWLVRQTVSFDLTVDHGDPHCALEWQRAADERWNGVWLNLAGACTAPETLETRPAGGQTGVGTATATHSDETQPIDLCAPATEPVQRLLPRRSVPREQPVHVSQSLPHYALAALRVRWEGAPETAFSIANPAVLERVFDLRVARRPLSMAGTAARRPRRIVPRDSTPVPTHHPAYCFLKARRRRTALYTSSAWPGCGSGSSLRAWRRAWPRPPGGTSATGASSWMLRRWPWSSSSTWAWRLGRRSCCRPTPTIISARRQPSLRRTAS